MAVDGWEGLSVKLMHLRRISSAYVLLISDGFEGALYGLRLGGIVIYLTI